MSRTKNARAAFLAFALAGAVGFAPVARAAHGGQHESSSPAPMKLEPEVMRMTDAGEEGYVTRDEFVKFQEKVLDALDGSGDRELAVPEFTDHG